MLNTETVAKKALDFLGEYFETAEHSDGDRADGRIAVSLLASHAKLVASGRAAQAMEMSLAQSLLEGQKLGEYVRAALPNSPLAGLLPVAGAQPAG